MSLIIMVGLYAAQQCRFAFQARRLSLTLSIHLQITLSLNFLAPLTRGSAITWAARHCWMRDRLEVHADSA